MSEAEQPAPATEPSTLYERVGGTPWFERLTERFYSGVAADPILRPVYPSDLEGARERLCGFLVQYWGGPADYSAVRGHPRLRMRHMRFTIGLAERDAWYRHMAAAVKAGGLAPDDEQIMLRYFAGTATQPMVAATAARTPAGESSNARHRAGSTPRLPGRRWVRPTTGRQVRSRSYAEGSPSRRASDGIAIGRSGCCCERAIRRSRRSPRWQLTRGLMGTLTRGTAEPASCNTHGAVCATRRSVLRSRAANDRPTRVRKHQQIYRFKDSGL